MVHQHKSHLWYHVVDEKLKAKHGVQEVLVLHVIWVVSCEVDPEIEEHSCNQARSQDKSEDKNALTHHELAHLEIQIVCEGLSNHSDQIA